MMKQLVAEDSNLLRCDVVSLVEELPTFIKIVVLSRSGSLGEPQFSHCVSVLFYVGLFVVNSSGQRRLASWLPFEESRCFLHQWLEEGVWKRSEFNRFFFASVGREAVLL